ncbi:efflux RND transporter periplasmic adaptor subunit [Chitinimonas sp. PSY-7]|uniref:efflux RND transporter periplasmic adaptor subunit n=1 Tax=Chitinimonas sp. PSY-7 TaxID=3459088 RepID=UPI0040403A0E
MKSKTRLGLISAAVLLGLGWMTLFLKPASVQASSTKPAADHAALTVEVVQPELNMWSQTLQANGALAAWQEASISAETNGLRIAALHTDVGSKVKRGQLLAELVNDTIKAEVRQAEAAVALAQANRLQAQNNAQRGQAVKGSGALSNQQIEQYLIAEKIADANLASAEAALSNARIKLAQTRIVAVDDGIITSRTATLGSVVNGSELFRLLRQGRLEWRAEVSAQQMAVLTAGQSATITLPNGETAQGKVRLLAPTLTSETRTAIAYVDLGSQTSARAGMYAQGQIELGQRKTLTVPTTAITVRDGHSYVFEIDAQQKVIQHKVSTGRSQGAQTEITHGLALYTRIVRSGGTFLNDGDTVRLAVASKEAV